MCVFVCVWCMCSVYVVCVVCVGVCVCVCVSYVTDICCFDWVVKFWVPKNREMTWPAEIQSS